MFVFLSRCVMFNILFSIFVCAAASVFFAWLVSAHVFALYDIAFITLEQACSNVTIEDVAVLGHDSSLNLLVSGAVSLSQIAVALNVLDLSVVDILCRFPEFHHHLCLRLVHLQTLIVTSIS